MRTSDQRFQQNTIDERDKSNFKISNTNHNTSHQKFRRKNSDDAPDARGCEYLNQHLMDPIRTLYIPLLPNRSEISPILELQIDIFQYKGTKETILDNL